MKNIELYKDKIGVWDDQHQGYFQVDPWTDEIFYGERANKRFMNSKNRSAFHNRRNRRENLALSRDTAGYKKNYKVLKELYPLSKDKNPIPSQLLLNKGYQNGAACLTSHIKDTGAPVYWYNNYGVEPVRNNHCVIYKKYHDGI